MTGIDYEAEYDNRAKVPEHPAILQGWARDAATFRAGHSDTEADLAYGDSSRQVLDVFWPAAGRDVPLAMFIHGGYWQALDKHFVSHLARGLVGRGIAVAVPSYELCPAVSLAEIVRQLQVATAFLVRRHSRNVFVTGHSAGGHLAASLLATDWPAHTVPQNAVSGCAALSGLFDLEPLIATSINRALGLDRATARRLSPWHMLRPGEPFFAIVGGLEGREYERQSQGMAQRWGGECQICAGRHHFDVVAPLSEPDSAMVERLAAQVIASAARFDAPLTPLKTPG